MYPFIPEYQTVKAEVKKGFEASHPDIELQFIDLDGNYYAPGSQPQDEYIGATKADVYELDSVFLRDFVNQKKIQLWPSDALLPEDELVKNAASGSRIDGARYGAAHWACGNFIFFKGGDGGFSEIKSLSDLEAAIGKPAHPIGKGLATDLKGKSTLGEFYLMAAVDHYGDWQDAKSHLGAVDPILENDLERLVKLCDAGYCRSDQYHSKDPGIYPRLFAQQKARAYLGYSEGLHDVLAESAQCDASSQCLGDSQIDVSGFPSDDNGRHQISWVDSYVLDADCNQTCTTDAVAFVKYMNSDEVYKTILLHTGPAPAYLLPAKAALYQDPEVVGRAHLYPKLKSLIESAYAPSDVDLNGELRKRGTEIDGQLPNNTAK
jgi:thiamine pyridinylase